ncbi:hypothetical protein P4U03_12370 [Bacillus mycoides]|uniref:DNA-binding protein n=2 Tax=Bacillus cereus group TaxID=86661 RepID=A0A243A755_BACTU|nr:MULTISPECIES: hypothetical protein [Bacillus cereus group]MED1267407.1 hypothetical protein [Bacillus mycoides]OTY12922.1 hypothetical protein BK732_22530 [Bacillus thuringiensis serovar navarrensis]TKI73805.1 hypothetical protein FC701_36770 [Bacillus mycoides]SCC45311.1 Putative phage-related DNA binding protein [Bacillus mycoides]
MYPNLRAEMARKGIVITQISSHLNLRYATVSDKINGKFRFYYDEALEIKETFFPDHNLEYLFEFEENKSNCSMKRNPTFLGT